MSKRVILLRFLALFLLVQVGGQMVFFPAFESPSPRTAHTWTNSADEIDCPTEFLLDKVLRLGDHIPGDEPENQWIEPVPASKAALIKLLGHIPSFGGLPYPSFFNLLSVTPSESVVYQTNFLLTALGNYRLLYRMHVF